MKRQRDLEAGKKVEENEQENKEEDNEESSPFEEFVLLKDFSKMSIKLYKKKDDDEDDDEDEDEDADN